ncbi:MAG: DHH family phosphoesterase, partial [Erysipelotrichales bacterium]|nr:DHH family phosphoesterase [Erysipelotrichales bacterium]
MRYVEQKCPSDYLNDINCSNLVRETLYWVCKEGYDPYGFFMEDDLYPISTSEHYVRVVSYLQECINARRKIVICGDYDCDGICSTTLLVMGLQECGITPGYYIPNRNKDGYGLSTKLVQQFYAKGYEVIICVDNGVVAHDAIDLAYQLGIEVVILDHHEMDHKTMQYPYLLHPLLMEEEYHYLCGSGVVFEILRSITKLSPYKVMLAALAAISDMMLLWGQNRRVVRIGLRVMREYITPLRYLVEGEEIDEMTLALKLAPKINAVGRMYDRANPNQLVKYLLSEDASVLLTVAKQIDKINEDRRCVSQTIQQQVIEKIDPSKEYILSYGDYHEGVVGLVASHLVHTYHKPVFVLANENGKLKGSCRSVSSIDLIDMLRECPHLDTFGGHKAAGGLSLTEDKLEAFERYIQEYMNTHVIQEDLQEYIALPEEDFTLPNLHELSLLRPYLRIQEEPLYRLDHLKMSKAVFMSE